MGSGMITWSGCGSICQGRPGDLIRRSMLLATIRRGSLFHPGCIARQRMVLMGQWARVNYAGGTEATLSLLLLSITMDDLRSASTYSCSLLTVRHTGHFCPSLSTTI